MSLVLIRCLQCVPVCLGDLPGVATECSGRCPFVTRQVFFLSSVSLGLPSPIALGRPCSVAGGSRAPVTGVPTPPNLLVFVPAHLLIFLVDLWASVFPLQGGVATLFGDGAAGPAVRSVSPPRVFGLASISVVASFPVVSLHWESGVLENEHVNFLRETLGK